MKIIYGWWIEKMVNLGFCTYSLYFFLNIDCDQFK